MAQSRRDITVAEIKKLRKMAVKLQSAQNEYEFGQPIGRPGRRGSGKDSTRTCASLWRGYCSATECAPGKSHRHHLAQLAAGAAASRKGSDKKARRAQPASKQQQRDR